MFLIGSLYNDLGPIGAMQTNKIVEEITTDTTTVGAIIDMQGADRMLLAAFTGVVQDGDYEFQLFHGDADDLADEAEVDASDLNGTLPNWVADTDDDKIVTVEYVCRKRYARIKVVSSTTTNGAYIGCAALLRMLKAPEQT